MGRSRGEQKQQQQKNKGEVGCLESLTFGQVVIILVGQLAHEERCGWTETHTVMFINISTPVRETAQEWLPCWGLFHNLVSSQHFSISSAPHPPVQQHSLLATSFSHVSVGFCSHALNSFFPSLSCYTSGKARVQKINDYYEVSAHYKH